MINQLLYVMLDDDQTFSTTTNDTQQLTNENINSFFAENYDLDNIANNTLMNNDIESSNDSKRRKSVSARYRSVTKETM